MQQGHMNAAQWAAVGINIFITVAKAAVKLARPQDEDLFANRLQYLPGALQQGSAIQAQESLIGAHTRAFAARQHEACYWMLHLFISPQRPLRTQRNNVWY